MAKVLLILEVSQKQAYIFSGKGLKDNIARSGNIARVTSDAWFLEKAPDLYSTEENLVYSGGGHTVLQFESRESAWNFAARITGTALRDYPGMELFAKIMDYDEAKKPGENLDNLTSLLEQKKSVRAGSLRSMSFGVEALNGENWQPGAYPEADKAEDILEAEPGFSYPREFKDVVGGDNFLAVVHADGNAMGTKVKGITGKYEVGQWQECRAALQEFSRNIDAIFRNALKAVGKAAADHVGAQAAKPDAVIARDKDGNCILPMRPIIQAGDDVCFVCSGELGLSCAAVFLNALEADKTGGTDYHACAGVAMVHAGYPFARAYELSEQLCSSAKKLGASIDPNGTVSAMDWHIEFGQLQDTLADTRRDYKTEDGLELCLRPVTVSVPAELKEKEAELTGGIRTWDYFRALCLAYQNKEKGLPRGKLKNLRTALKQGEVETGFYLADKQIANVLESVFDAQYRTEEDKWAQYRMIADGIRKERKAFPEIGGVKRCVLFDAIEMTDHFAELEADVNE